MQEGAMCSFSIPPLPFRNQRMEKQKMGMDASELTLSRQVTFNDRIVSIGRQRMSDKACDCMQNASRQQMSRCLFT